MKRIPTILKVMAAWYLALAAAACDLGDTMSGTIEDGVPTAAGIPTATEPQDVVAAACAVPLRIVVFQDKSASATTNRTPQISLGDLEPLLARIAACGGELALGIIAASSNEPLLRAYVRPPPPPPTFTQAVGNPYQLSRVRQRQNEAQVRHEEAVRHHQASLSEELAAFRRAAAEIVARRPDARRTDILGAVTRSAHFLAEPWPGGETRLVSVIISDGQNNVASGGVRPLPQGSELVLVNGEPDPGSLSEIPTARFESFNAAVRYILKRR